MIIDVLVAFDSTYEPLTGVMLTSLFRSNKNHTFNIHAFVGNEFGRSSEKKFTRFISRNHSRFFIYNLEDFDIISRCPLNPNSHITRSTYYRLLAPKILPVSVEKILYLDGDIIVNGDIAQLWTTDLNGYALAGAEDRSFALQSNYERLNYDSKYGYYNAGVTLYNLKYWRDHDVTSRVFDYIKENKDYLLWMDQDAVNGVLHKERKVLPIENNFQTFFFERSSWAFYSEDFKAEILKAAKSPLIIHYIGHAKPWHYHYYSYPFSKLWRKTAFQSLWWWSFLPHIDIQFIKFIVFRLVDPGRTLRIRNNEMVDVSYPLN